MGDLGGGMRGMLSLSQNHVLPGVYSRLPWLPLLLRVDCGRTLGLDAPWAGESFSGCVCLCNAETNVYRLGREKKQK